MCLQHNLLSTKKLDVLAINIMSIKIEKEGGICVPCKMDLYSKSVKRILTFKLNSLQNFNISSKVPSYEISWMVKNFPDWEQRGFDPLKSQETDEYPVLIPPPPGGGGLTNPDVN